MNKKYRFQFTFFPYASAWQHLLCWQITTMRYISPSSNNCSSCDLHDTFGHNEITIIFWLIMQLKVRGVKMNGKMFSVYSSWLIHSLIHCWLLTDTFKVEYFLACCLMFDWLFNQSTLNVNEWRKWWLLTILFILISCIACSLRDKTSDVSTYWHVNTRTHTHNSVYWHTSALSHTLTHTHMVLLNSLVIYVTLLPNCLLHSTNLIMNKRSIHSRTLSRFMRDISEFYDHIIKYQ